jgi:SNF2 family DNA or RNA helicase
MKPLQQAAELLSQHPEAIKKFPSIFDPRLGFSIVTLMRARSERFNLGAAKVLHSRCTHYEMLLAQQGIFLETNAAEELMEDFGTPTKIKATKAASPRSAQKIQNTQNSGGGRPPTITKKAPPAKAKSLPKVNALPVPSREYPKCPPPQWKIEELNLRGKFGKFELREHQVVGVSWSMKRERAVINDTMGLGKTVTSLVTASAYGTQVYVLTKPGLVENWYREVKGLGLEGRVTVVSNHITSIQKWLTMQKNTKRKSQWDVQLGDYFSEPFVFLIDEVHEFGSEEAQRTQAAMAIADSENCVAFYGLTGTLMPNGRPIELWPLVRMLRHPLSLNKGHYERFYCNARQRTMGGRLIWDNKGATNLDDLQLQDWVITRKANECLDLPPKIRIPRQIEVSTKAQKEYEKTLAEVKLGQITRLVKQFQEDEGLSLDDAIAKANEKANNPLTQLLQVRYASSIAKVDEAVAMAKEAMAQGNQVILFSWFKRTASMIAEQLNCEMVSGEVKDKQANVDHFQEGQFDAISCTFGAGGVGLNITRASTVILVDRPWTLAIAEQAEARAHRMGQKNDCVISIWLSAFDVDKMIDDLVISKGERIELLLRGKRKTLRGISAKTPGDIAKVIMPLLRGQDVSSLTGLEIVDA